MIFHLNTEIFGNRIQHPAGKEQVNEINRKRKEKQVEEDRFGSGVWAIAG